MTFIVGLAGPAKVGKTTTAKALCAKLKDKCGYPDCRVDVSAFASPLYNLASLLTGVHVDTLMDQSYKETPWTAETAPLPCLVGWTPRKFLQIVGTQGFRDLVHQDIWAQAAIKATSGSDIAFMADARFVNEYKMCDIVIELSRDGIEYACDHPSAMPPPQELVHHKLKLFKDLDFSPIVDIIYNTYVNSGKNR